MSPPERPAASRRRRAGPARDRPDETLPGRVALVGESGSGKSTVARLLAQLVARAAGRVPLRTLLPLRHRPLSRVDPVLAASPVPGDENRQVACWLHAQGSAPADLTA